MGEPIFGYNLETFPFKTLRPGSIMIETQGTLNIKNPACYVYPEENGCSPGDHFTVEQKDSALAFAGFRKFPYEISFLQKVANGITLITLTAYALFFTGLIIGRFRAPGR